MRSDGCALPRRRSVVRHQPAAGAANRGRTATVRSRGSGSVAWGRPNRPDLLDPPDLLDSPASHASEPLARLVIELRRQSLEAGGTDAVAELRIGMLRHVAFHLLPVLIVAANPFAVAADRQQTAQLLDVRQRRLQLGDAVSELLLQRQHA